MPELQQKASYLVHKQQICKRSCPPEKGSAARVDLRGRECTMYSSKIYLSTYALCPFILLILGPAGSAQGCDVRVPHAKDKSWPSNQGSRRTQHKLPCKHEPSSPCAHLRVSLTDCLPLPQPQPGRYYAGERSPPCTRFALVAESVPNRGA